jgi:3-amino-4-hydroxybenzoic acid synthase
MTKLSWLDIRGIEGESKPAIVEEAIHQRVDGIVVASLEDISSLPPTVTRIVHVQNGYDPGDDLQSVDVLLVDYSRNGEAEALKEKYPEVEIGRFIEVLDQPTLDEACEAARSEKWTLIRFKDPTKIPLEIVLASANNSSGSIITEVSGMEEAEIVLGVLEKGSDGVMLAPKSVGEATKLKEICEKQSPPLNLLGLKVEKIEHAGMGDRACVDTCSYLGKDEGILVGSHSNGMILACSETHPLPYMPTRPFRVNAGALHSYVVGADGRTNYLSELESGSKILAVNTRGKTREVVVGRVKIESRPLLSIDAIATSGERVNLILQDDWHVRLLGPEAAVLNVTELKPGDEVLGCLMSEQRHVGIPIDEFCVEQ